MKIVVVGADGQLGSDVSEEFARACDQVYRLGHGDVEIASLDSVSQLFSAIRPDVIVNTAAFHHVDLCEKEPTSAFATNALGARNLATVAHDLDAVLIHVSTDYVFDGMKGEPYHESDPPRPLNVYGNSKLAGEYFVQSAGGRYFIVRTSALYGKRPCRAKGGLNFVQLMLKLAKERSEVKVVDSEVITPTPTIEVARQMVKLSRCDAFGVYHATAEGGCTWYEFAQEIFALAGSKVRLSVAGPGDFLTKVPRPKYSVLENRGLNAIQLNGFTHWKNGLSEYLCLARSEAGKSV